ncbi:uncharacterized protein [Montipora foliosa]|uniref:uncharacterized protein isoform X1 n=1 Tax=Montipora foliosa TaxID=591990 RepID=UPI0035F11D06
MMRSCDVLLVLWAILFLCSSAKSSQLEIQAFQPAVVPIRAITTLTLKTNVDVNVTSNTSLQCRFKDISVPARMEDGFIFCDTPPIKNTDRISLHLDIDGKLFKTKRPLYFHEPFKVSNITPSVVSPAQHVHLTISGISCKDWMQYFVRFQTANGTKKTQQGICRDSVVSCFVPEFPPNTLLRVGLTLSNRLVEWSDAKILIQYPGDAMKSSVDDITTDFTKEGAFRFVVVLKDRFNNPIKLTQRTNKNPTPISVQYSSKAKPQSLRFLRCTTTVRNNGAGDEYVLSCEGAEKEDIFFYPSMNNVPLGGKDMYEAKTTLCPGKNSCKAEPKSSLLVTVLACLGTALLVSLVAVLFFVRYKAARKGRVTPETTTGLEMEVQPPENEDRMLFYDPENNASANSHEEETAARTTQEDAYADNSSGLKLGDSGAPEEDERDHQTDVLEEVGSMHQRSFEKGDKNYVQSKEEIEMKLRRYRNLFKGEEAERTVGGKTALEGPKSSALFYDLEDTASANSDEEETAARTTQEDAYADNSSGLKLGDSGAPEEDERDHQTDVLEEVGSMHQRSFEKGDKNYVQSKEEIEMKLRRYRNLFKGEEAERTVGGKTALEGPKSSALFYDLEDTASANSDEEETAARTTQEDAYADNSSGLKLGDSGAPEEDERDHQTDVLEEVGSMHQRSFEKGDKNYVQSKEEIEMKLRRYRNLFKGEEAERTVGGKTALEGPKSSALFYDLEDTASANSDEEETAARTTQEDAYADNSSGLKLGDSGAPEEDERDHQTDVLEEVGSMHQRSFEKGDKNYVQSKEEIEMKGMQVRQFENYSELSSDQDFRESARSSPLPEALLCGDPCGDTMAVTAVSSSSDDIDALACTGDGSNVHPCQEQCMDKIRKQTAERRKYRPGKNKVLPMECEPVTPGQTKYTDRFKKADHYRQAWIENLLGEDE